MFRRIPVLILLGILALAAFVQYGVLERRIHYR